MFSLLLKKATSFVLPSPGRLGHTIVCFSKRPIGAYENICGGVPSAAAVENMEKN